MIADKSVEIKSPVVTLKALHDGNLILMDKMGTLRYIDAQNYKTIDGFKTKIEQERSWGNHMSVSASGKYAACVIPKSNKAALYDIHNRKLLYTTSRHKGDLESVCVDDDNHYFVTGGTDGKTYVWNLETAKLVYSFPPHADYITALEINSIWIASASYDRNISVLNLTTMQTPIRLSGHQSVIIQMKLLKGMKMLSADKTGNVILWDLRTSKAITRFKKINDDVNCFCVSADERFLFVGTKLGNVVLYDIQSGECLKRSFVKESTKVTALTVLKQKNQLVVGTKSGRLNFYSLVPKEHYLVQQLKVKAYDVLYDLVEENPLLRYSYVYNKLEQVWESTLKKATKLLEMGQKENARNTIAPFEKVRSKGALIQELFKDYREYETFVRCVNEKKYSLAYPLANRHPHFKKSDAYRFMENEWHIQFNKAKTILLKKDGDERVRKLLSSFKGISEKSILIQELFQQRTAYMLFQKKLAQKDYQALFTLLERCPFIKEFDEYDDLIAYADNLYIKAHQSLENEDYADCVKYASELLLFPDFKDDVLEMMERSKVYQDFSDAFHLNDVPKMYEMIGKNPYLMERKEAKEIEGNWYAHLLLAEKFASRGDVSGVVSSLKDFFEIKSKYVSVAIVMQQAYMSQLGIALRTGKSEVLIARGLEKYIRLFGLDEHVENFLEKYEGKRGGVLHLSAMQNGDITLFRPSMIINDIVEM